MKKGRSMRPTSSNLKAAQTFDGDAAHSLNCEAARNILPAVFEKQHLAGEPTMLSFTSRISTSRSILRMAPVLLAIAFFCSQTMKTSAADIAPGETSRQSVFTAYDAQAKAVLATMTLDEKVGQMMQPDQGSLKDPSDIEKYFLGSLLSGGGSGPKAKDAYTLQGWTDMVDSYQQHAIKTRLGIPLLYGIDAVHGNNNIPGATIFPHNIALGCTRDPELVQRIERVTADEVRAVGINWVFSPCITVPQDIRWGRTYEGYSSDPAIVGPLGAAAVRGFQGENLFDPLSVVACAKHFVGDGGTALGSARGNAGPRLDQGDTRVDEATRRKIHLPGYAAAVNAGVGTVMASYSSWNGVKDSANAFLLTDVLKHQLGFEGFVISDYNAIDQISPDYENDIQISINAGIDMVMMTNKYPEFFADLKDLVAQGKVPMSRIDDAVTRILRVKFALGLMDKNRSPLADRALVASFGSAEHRAVARQAVRESLVLLKNEKKTPANNTGGGNTPAGNLPVGNLPAALLPLSKNIARIHVAGRGADNLGMQCGGWTIDWQGRMGRPIPGATSILTAIKNTVAKTASVTYSIDGKGADGADVGVVVIGETPYAEGRGDNADLSLAQEDRDAVANMKAAGIPVVVVVLSGRPLILGDVLDQADALIAAWLPGSEGQGVADILFGDAKPTGKLSYAWPKSIAQLPAATNPADAPPAPSAPLFNIGFGLTYER
jgi:beta-glucosidase